MNILVTGGAGFIGSFVVKKLHDEGHKVVVADSLLYGKKDSLKGVEIREVDMVNQPKELDNIFDSYDFDGVLHMASLIQMGESFRDPNVYFKNNLISTINLTEAMVKHNVLKVVFSSSAGVYGIPKKLPIKEDDPKNPQNPYGETKLQIERILYWMDKAYGMKSIALRYFNAAGAALDGSMGEDHPNESHLIPLIIKAALAKKEFVMNGNDYKTKDGTCIRDYVHVLDLADAHVLAIKALVAGAQSNYYNVGIGVGYSNMQIISEVETVAGRFKWKFGPRRPGDADALYASIDKIKKELKWRPKYRLTDVIRSAYLWHSMHPHGYSSMSVQE